LGKEKLVLGNANQLPGNIDRLSGKADPGAKSGSDKVESGPSYRCGLREESEPIFDKEDNEESVTKKSESRNDGSPVDEEKMEPMKEDDSIKGLARSGQIGGCHFWSALEILERLRTRKSSGKC
jgi:hypothetical protein